MGTLDLVTGVQGSYIGPNGVDKGILPADLVQQFFVHQVLLMDVIEVLL